MGDLEGKAVAAEIKIEKGDRIGTGEFAKMLDKILGVTSHAGPLCYRRLNIDANSHCFPA
jgi:hypothetical protein